MKIQILISKNSWALKYVPFIKKRLIKFSNKIQVINDHKFLKKNYDINVIFSYFKILDKKFLNRSKSNLVVHASNLPNGRGMSPLTWQILDGKSLITFSLIEVNEKMDEGKYYFKKKVRIPKHYIFDEIKKLQLDQTLILIIKFIKVFKKNKMKLPHSYNQIGKPSYFKKRTMEDSKLNVHKSLNSQFNKLRVCDNDNYPAFFILNKKKYVIKIYNKSKKNNEN